MGSPSPFMHAPVSCPWIHRTNEGISTEYNTKFLHGCFPEHWGHSRERKSPREPQGWERPLGSQSLPANKMRTDADVDSGDRQQEITGHTGIQDKKRTYPATQPCWLRGISTSVTSAAFSTSQGGRGCLFPSCLGMWKPRLSDLSTTEKVEEEEFYPILSILGPVLFLPHSRAHLAGPVQEAICQGSNLSSTVYES